MEEEKRPTLIHEINNRIMVSVEDGKSTWRRRRARFLNPRAQNVTQAVGNPNTSSTLSELFAKNHRQCPPNIDFKGWKHSPKDWNEWVDRLAEKHAALWNQTGICDAIMSSLYDVPFNRDLVLGLVEFWCPETNTFVFPWGEATITLEDVMILGGFSVIGESPSDEELKIDEGIWSSDRFSGRGWHKQFLEGENSEMEHIGFLSLWLWRCVFPSVPEHTVLPIACQLSLGSRVALAQPVLANIYHTLTLLRTQIIDSCKSIVVSEPLQLLQLWAFEHFPDLRPMFPNALKQGEPRVARWHNLNPTLDVEGVRSRVKRVGRFEWRPYAADLRNWRHLSYYKDTEQVLVSMDEEMESFLKCLQASELKGVCYKTKYLPQRVAMQFGLDQDLPGGCCVCGKGEEGLRLSIPARTFQPGVSARYLSWWEDKMGHNSEEQKLGSEDFRIASQLSIQSSETKNDCNEKHNLLGVVDCDHIRKRRKDKGIVECGNWIRSEAKGTKLSETSKGCQEIVVGENRKRRRVGESRDDPVDVEKAGECFDNPLYIDDCIEVSRGCSRVNEVEDLKKALGEVKKLNKTIKELKTANYELSFSKRTATELWRCDLRMDPNRAKAKPFV